MVKLDKRFPAVGGADFNEALHSVAATFDESYYEQREQGRLLCRLFLFTFRTGQAARVSLIDLPPNTGYSQPYAVAMTQAGHLVAVNPKRFAPPHALFFLYDGLPFGDGNIHILGRSWDRKLCMGRIKLDRVGGLYAKAEPVLYEYGARTLLEDSGRHLFLDCFYQAYADPDRYAAKVASIFN